MLTAGIIWVGVGGLVFLSTLVELALLFGAAQPAAANDPRGAGFATGLLCGMVIRGAICAAFVYVGVQTVRGAAKDTLGNAIGSILFGLFQVGGGLVVLAAKNVVGAVMGLGAGVVLFAAGIFALVGRSEYKEWRRLRRRRRKRRRIRREEAAEDEA